MCDPGSSKRLHQVLRPAAGVLCVSRASPLRCNECLYGESCRACLSALSLRSAAVGGLRPWEPTLQPVICRWTAEPLDGGRVHPRVFAPLVCLRRFYFSSSSRPSAATLHLRSRARGSSQVEIPPCETTTLCLCWFERTRPVGTSCSASDAPCRFWARSRETTSNVPAVSSSLFFFFFLALSCVWRLLHFSSWRQRRGRGNHLKCDKLKGKPPGMNEHWGGEVSGAPSSPHLWLIRALF